MAVTYYVTLDSLAEKPGAVELAQVTTQSGKPVVNHVVLDAVLRGEDTSSYPAEQLELAMVSVERIGDAVSDAQSLINGYLQQRGHKLPLRTIPRLLTTWARAIARYYLHQHRISDDKTDPIVRDYREALRLLQQMAEGKYSLGIDDPLPVGGGKPQIIGPRRTFNMNTLKDYGR